LVGVITLYSTRLDAFNAEHQRILEVVSTQVAPAIHAASSTKQPRYSDRAENALSDLPSMDDVKRALGQHDGRGLPHPTSAIIVSIRDAAWVPAKERDGSQDTLYRVASSLRHALRAADLLFRAGPHDFGVLLLKTSAETCFAIVNQMRSEWDSFADVDKRHSLLISNATTTTDDMGLETLVAEARRRGVASPARKDRGSSTDSVH
jgi:hypothetical protein